MRTSQKVHRLKASALGCSAIVVAVGCGQVSAHQRASSAGPVSPSSSQSTPISPPRSAPAPASTGANDSPTGCGDWIGDGTELRSDIEKQYGEIDDCGSLGGAWIITTDQGSDGIGSVGAHLCSESCQSDIPVKFSDWTFYQPNRTVGTNNRLAGVNPDGTIIFTGGDGEYAFDAQTGQFTPEAGH